jgi:hypothetical protein
LKIELELLVPEFKGDELKLVEALSCSILVYVSKIVIGAGV